MRVLRSRALRIVALSLIHLILTLGILIVSYASAMEDFDHADRPGRLRTQAASTAASVLMFPGMPLWSLFPPGAPNALEWFLFFGNSALWGTAATVLIERSRVGPRATTA